MATVGVLAVMLTANPAALVSGIRSAQGAVNNFCDNGLDRMQKKMEHVESQGFVRLQKAALSFKNVMASGIFGVGIKSVIETGMEFERLEYKMIAATGSAALAANELGFVRSESERLGLRLKDAANMFGTLAASAKGTSLEGEKVRQIFTAISEAATVMRLSSEDVNGALYAISQMISKGKVSMEELRQQLGERLPGALLLAQRAMGLTGQEFDKLITKGGLTADVFLPKLSAEIQRTYGEAVPNAIKSTQSELNRFLTTWDDIVNTIARSGVIEAFRLIMKTAAEVFKYINFAVSNFVALVIKGFNLMEREVKNVLLMVEYAGRSTFGNLVTSFSESLLAIANGVDWINKKLNGIDAAPTTGGIRKLAEEMSAYGKDAGMTYDQLLEKSAAYRKEMELQNKSVDDILYERYQALYEKPIIQAPHIPNVMDVAPKNGGGVTSKDTEGLEKSAKALDNYREKLSGLQEDMEKWGRGTGPTGFAKEIQDAEDKYKDVLTNIAKWGRDALEKGVPESYIKEQTEKAMQVAKEAKTAYLRSAWSEEEDEYTKASNELDLEKQRAYINLVAELRTEEERLTTQLTERLAVLDSVGVATQQDYERAAGQLTMEAPDYGGLAPEVGGVGGELEKIAAAEASLNEWYATQLEMLDTFRTQRADLTAVWDAEELALEKEKQGKLQELERARLNTSLVAAENTFGSLADMTKTFAGEQSSAYKAMFTVQKAFAIAESIVAIQTGIALAAKNPWPMNLAAMASVAAATASIVGNIQAVSVAGMAHDGIDAVPKTGTWLLEKGERVLTANTSAKLDKQLDQTRQQESNVRIINVMDPAIVGDYLDTPSGERMIMNVVQRNQGA